jgi:hypothetical protein
MLESGFAARAEGVLRELLAQRQAQGRQLYEIFVEQFGGSPSPRTEEPAAAAPTTSSSSSTESAVPAATAEAGAEEQAVADVVAILADIVVEVQGHLLALQAAPSRAEMNAGEVEAVPVAPTTMATTRPPSALKRGVSFPRDSVLASSISGVAFSTTGADAEDS